MGQRQTVRRILIVDDEENVAQSFKEGLEMLPDCDISVATSGRQALQFFEQRSFDLLITDHRMPGMSGMAVASEVRRRYPKTAIIVITAHDSDALREAAACVSVFGILEKPVGLVEARNASLAALGHRQVGGGKDAVYTRPAPPLVAQRQRTALRPRSGRDRRHGSIP